MILPEIRPAPRYRSEPFYLGDLASRARWAERKPHIEIEVMRDHEVRHLRTCRNRSGKIETFEEVEVVGRHRVRRRGILNRAVGKVIHVGCFVYHMNEILAYRLCEDSQAMDEVGGDPALMDERC